jgi:hypothetical protein
MNDRVKIEELVQKWRSDAESVDDFAARFTIHRLCEELSETLSISDDARPDPVAWMIDCIDPDTQIEYTSVTLDPGSATPQHTPLYAALSTPTRQAGDGWRGIESAPRDGSVLLVTTGNRDVRTARWSLHKRSWLVAYDKHAVFANCVQPTHWQPLPAAPQAQPPQGGGGEVV